MASKTAIITGTSSGIGEAIAHSLLKQDWEVYGISRSGNKTLATNSNFHQLICDLSSTDAIEKVAKDLPTKVNALFNNAGVWELVNLEDVTLEHINRIIHTNLRAPIYLTSLLLPRIEKGGHIINTSSIISSTSIPGYGVYAATKAGMDRFTTTLAKERQDLHVSAVLPSATDTLGNRKVLGKDGDYSTFITTEQIASVAMDLLNDKYQSGSLVAVNNSNFKSLWEDKDRYQLVMVVN
jgi:NAD(P)-dependent dehydrogenase (short-subunit alcohol dehydrogenase family)